MKALVVISFVLLTVVMAPSAQQPATAISPLDIELWKATLQVIQHDKREPLALLNETLPAVDIKRTLRAQDRESSTLIDKALSRNEVIVRILSPVAGIDLVEIGPFGKSGPSSIRMRLKLASNEWCVLACQRSQTTEHAHWSFRGPLRGSMIQVGRIPVREEGGVWTFVNYVAAWIA
jgi:hypothetical protein